MPFTSGSAFLKSLFSATVESQIAPLLNYSSGCMNFTGLQPQMRYTQLFYFIHLSLSLNVRLTSFIYYLCAYQRMHSFTHLFIHSFNSLTRSLSMRGQFF